MLILCNYDAGYHIFMNFLHWRAILLKSIFLRRCLRVMGRCLCGTRINRAMCNGTTSIVGPRFRLRGSGAY